MLEIPKENLCVLYLQLCFTIRLTVNDILSPKVARSVIADSAMDEHVIEELRKLMELQTDVFIVHMSYFLVSRVLFNAKKLGMMSEGYAWIMTTKSMNYLHSGDLSAIESMQGVLGFKPYIPASKELHNFTSRWRRKFNTGTDKEDPIINIMELGPFGIWAYDVMWVLAKAAESAGPRVEQPDNLIDLDGIRTSTHGSTLLKEMSQSKFKGLSGELQFNNGELIFQTFEIINVIGNGGRRVGFWTYDGKITKQLYPSRKSRLLSSTKDLEAIIWPGGSVAIPKGRMTQKGGKKLRIGVPVRSGFPELLKVDSDLHTNETTATGFCVDVFKAAIESSPYQVEYEFVASRLHYHELIDEVYHQTFDAVVGDMTITANRSLYVDFTLPFTDLGVGIIAPKHDRNIWIFLSPLTPDLWLSSAAFFILTGFVVWLIERPINDEFQGSVSRQIGTILWFSFSTLVFAHREKLLNNLSRFVVSVWVFVVLILTSSYTATLTSMLTVQQINLNSKGVYVGFQELGAVSNNVKDSVSSRSSPQAYAIALSRGSKNGGVSAIMDEIPYLRIFLAKYSVDYSMVAQMSTTNGFGFVFTKGSQLVPEVSRAIARLREEGKLNKLEELWFHDNGRSSFTSQDSESNPVALNFNKFRGLFLITGTSTMLALVIFFLSVLHRKWHHVVRNCSIFVHVVGEKLGFVKYI